MNRSLAAIAALAVWGLLIVASAEATTTTLRESESYETDIVNIRTDSSANQNRYGLHVGTDYYSRNYRGLLEFDLSAVPAGQTVESVSLTLTSNRGSGSTTLGLYSYAYDFDETTAKWCYPSAADAVAGGTPGDLLATLYYSSNWGVAYTFADNDLFRAAVADALAADEPARFMLIAQNTGTIATIYGDENTPYVQYRPTLSVVTADAPPVPEPATMAACLLGLGGLGRYVRRRCAA